MNDEQINEVMRLVRDAVVTNSLFATEQIADMSIVGEAKCALVSYLRTIGEPENTFPLNPNAASKWAHLQKHDGAKAIGVVFRTGSGSVGSLVDGRVVWADWLAHPTGSKPESVNAELLEALKESVKSLAGYRREMHCGQPCDAERLAVEVIARAESIETPAKVSPCAGHAVQQDADTCRDWPEDFHHENGQYMNTCHVCKNTFIGHKRRVVCKVCNNGFIRVQQEADEAGGAA